MSREWVLKTLVDLSYSQVEAEVYFYLAQAGPLKGRDITNTLKFHKHQVYRSLKNLQCKGCIKAALKRPAQFFAVPLEKVLDQSMKEKNEQAKALQASREELLSNWRSMIEKNSATN